VRTRENATGVRRIAIVVLVSAALGGAPTGSGSSWPASDARLDSPSPSFASGFGVRRIFLDAGHGAENNPGNRSAFCLEEQSFTLDLAHDVARVLADSTHFEVLVSRAGSDLVSYPDRVRKAEAWGADAFVSLHSDVRGHGAERACLRSREAPGFSILWSKEGEPSLVDHRRELARKLADELGRSGFLPFDGAGYQSTYAADPEQRGSFVDRHAESERIFVLWRPTMPSLIVETHNALDDREALRWNEPGTRLAFANALSRALAAALARQN
jgi:N-acetylmuramoyl-L-alanine amidase